jgi:methionyl-tRNA formyltransferase
LTKPKVLFLGTAPIAVPTLYACAQLDEIELVGVVSQPPSKRGRGRKLQPSAVQQAAEELGYPLATPHRFHGAEGDAILDRFAPDACVVIAYGQIIKANHLERCKNRWVNRHGSLLPRWRGAAPIERCLEAGDPVTGVQLMLMETGLDTGPIFAERRVPTAGHNAHSLSIALGEEAAKLTQSHLTTAISGLLEPTYQNNDQAIYAHRVLSAEGHIDFRGKAEIWARRSRAFDPRLGLRCRLIQAERNLGIKIWSAHAESPLTTDKPGKIIKCDASALWVSCEEGVLNITSLQVDGKKRLSWSQARSGLALTTSDYFKC